MQRDWTQDKDWADRYWPHIERIIRRVVGRIVSIAPTDQDEDQAGRDYKVECGGVAARLRRPHVEQRDVTIRSSRRSGVPTDLQKWSQGAADWLVYGWADGTAVPEWVVVDIGGLIGRGLHLDKRETWNRDGGSAFIAVDVHEIIAAGLLIDGVVTVPTSVSKFGRVYPVIRCYKCNCASSVAGPAGLPERQCRKCHWIWTPPVDPQDPVLRAALDDPRVKAALTTLEGQILDVGRRQPEDRTDLTTTQDE